MDECTQIGCDERAKGMIFKGKNKGKNPENLHQNKIDTTEENPQL